MRVLILGGTTEASALARRLGDDARFAVTLSLAGRTGAPKLPIAQTRVGGFGGAEGLARWIKDNGIEAVIDATHPFAARISANAAATAGATGIPLVSLLRRPWQQRPGDKWISVPDMAAAATALADTPQHVFLTIGRQEVAAFRAAPQHAYVIRAIEQPAADALPPNTEVILQRGPYDAAAEAELMRTRKIDIVVAKNSGADATYAKIAAARSLDIPVIMVEQPHKPAGIPVETIEAVVEQLVALHAHAGAPSERGV